MIERYDNGLMSAEFRHEDNVVTVSFRAKAQRDDFRTPMMHAADLARKHKADALIIDLTIDPDITEDDERWMVKCLIPEINKSKIPSTVLVIPEGDERRECCTRLYSSKLKFTFASTMDEAITAVTGVGTTSVGARADSADDKIADTSAVTTTAPDDDAPMTKPQALEVLGLPQDADSQAIEDKYNEILERYSQKISVTAENDFSKYQEAYEVASGARERRAEEAAAEAAKPRFLGMTKEQWKDYFYYTWYKYLIGIVVIAVFIYGFVGYFSNNNAISVVSIGYFEHDNTYMTEILENAGFTQPYIAHATVVVANDEGIKPGEYANDVAMAILQSNPNVIITDELTSGYYFDYYGNMENLEEDLVKILPKEVYDKLEPVYKTQAEEYRLRKAYEDSKDSAYVESDDDGIILPQNDAPVMIGYRIKDPDMMAKLGFTSGWKTSDKSLVIGIYAYTQDLKAAETALATILVNAYEGK